MEPASQKFLDVAELAGGLAHELRNPLSTMMIHLKLLAEDLTDESAHFEDVRRRSLQKVDVLRRESERLQALFDQFLKLAGPCPLDRSVVDLNAVIARLAEFFDPVAKNQGITLHARTAPGSVCANIDEKLISQALLNLVINAQQAMPNGGTLVIEVAEACDIGEVVISVSDTGPGIAPSVREHIFRPFFSTKGTTGSGLGLSITKRIVEEHGGTLGFNSQPGSGTTFTARLPGSSNRDEMFQPSG